jgi:hypothetical protein
MPIERTPSGSVTVTGNAINLFRLMAVLQGARLYLKTGMQVNRMYTPANMKAVIGEYTGKTYPRSRKGLMQAVADAEAVIASCGDNADKLSK